jgi:hypothetical protein
MRRLFAIMWKTLERQLPRKPALAGGPIDPLPADALVRPSMHNRVTTQVHNHDDW